MAQLKQRRPCPSDNAYDGECNCVYIARLLKEGGNVLQLDEPMNDLDMEFLRAFEDAVVEFAGCAVVITHKRFFLDHPNPHFRGENVGGRGQL